jgi:hypothetical protein
LPSEVTSTDNEPGLKAMDCCVLKVDDSPGIKNPNRAIHLPSDGAPIGIAILIPISENDYFS